MDAATTSTGGEHGDICDPPLVRVGGTKVALQQIWSATGVGSTASPLLRRVGADQPVRAHQPGDMGPGDPVQRKRITSSSPGRICGGPLQILLVRAELHVLLAELAQLVTLGFRQPVGIVSSSVGVPGLLDPVPQRALGDSERPGHFVSTFGRPDGKRNLPIGTGLARRSTPSPRHLTSHATRSRRSSAATTFLVGTGLGDTEITEAGQLYEDGLSLAAIGELLEISARPVLNAFRKVGFDTRPVGTNVAMRSDHAACPIHRSNPQRVRIRP